MKILVIDDSRAIVCITEMILTDLGHKVMTAFDGIEGMRLFNNNDFDLVVTDLSMPGIDGNEVAFQIRALERPYIPIIGKPLSSNSPVWLPNIGSSGKLMKPKP